MRFSALVLAALLSLVFTEARADALARIKDSGVIKLGYREDAAPFSYRNDRGEPAGYSVGLCGAVVAALQQELNQPDLEAKFVPVGAEDRFTALQNGTIDLLCGATTATLSRRQLVDFSLPTFIDGASVLFLKDGPADFEGLAGHKVGVRGGTTTEEALRNSLKELAIDAQIVAVTDHKDGLRGLEAGELSAYFADQGILLFLMLQSQSPQMLRLSGRFFTREPYALALPRGDSELRLLVDRTLSRLYRTGKVRDHFSKAFGPVRPSKLLEALFVVSGLPE
jgi:polar amino acid transport system substrate-binding protein/glutamate/aspartate transport system substrate-binding protein